MPATRAATLSSPASSEPLIAPRRTTSICVFSVWTAANTSNGNALRIHCLVSYSAGSVFAGSGSARQSRSPPATSATTLAATCRATTHVADSESLAAAYAVATNARNSAGATSVSGVRPRTTRFSPCIAAWRMLVSAMTGTSNEETPR